MENIDTEISKFIDKIKDHEIKNEIPVFNNNLVGAGTTPIITLNEVSDFSITEFDEDTFAITARYEDIEGKMLGLDKEDYANLIALLLPLLENNFYSKFS